jgi:hypothetical protein
MIEKITCPYCKASNDFPDYADDVRCWKCKLWVNNAKHNAFERELLEAKQRYENEVQEIYKKYSLTEREIEVARTSGIKEVKNSEGENGE